MLLTQRGSRNQTDDEQSEEGHDRHSNGNGYGSPGAGVLCRLDARGGTGCSRCDARATAREQKNSTRTDVANNVTHQPPECADPHRVDARRSSSDWIRLQHATRLKAAARHEAEPRTKCVIARSGSGRSRWRLPRLSLLSPVARALGVPPHEASQQKTRNAMSTAHSQDFASICLSFPMPAGFRPFLVSVQNESHCVMVCPHVLERS